MRDALKKTFKKIIAWKLEWLAKMALKKYKPKIVAITGSVGKTSTKEMVARVLGAKYKVRGSQKSFNSELGVPLTILDLPTAWSNPWLWLVNLCRGLWLVVWPHDYPEWLVLEVGADRPGDISKVASWLKVDVVVLTRVPDVPVHVEYFKSAGAVIAEKLSLINGLKSDGVLVVNSDDPNLAGALTTKKDQVKITYGFEGEATVYGSHPHIVYQEVGGLKKPNGIACKVDYEGKNFSLRLPGVIAVHQLYAVLAAFAVGVSQGVEALEAVEALAHTVVPAGRMRLVEGIKGSLILDDTYNAAPVAVSSALEMLGRLETTGKRIAALGDMLELGNLTIDTHRQIGAEAATVADMIVAVGIRAKFILEAAREAGKPEQNLKWFDNSREAGVWLQNQIGEGDTILVKGSQGIRMEKVVEEIMLRPELKEELLCRQEKEWQER